MRRLVYIGYRLGVDCASTTCSAEQEQAGSDEGSARFAACACLVCACSVLHMPRLYVHTAQV